MRYVSIKNEYDLKVSTYVTEFIDSEYIYVPINDFKTLKIKSNDYIYKEQELAQDVYAPVSGNILGIQDCVDAIDHKIQCLVIKNDGKERFKEVSLHKQKFNEYQKEEILNILHKYNLYFLDNIEENLVINAIEDDIYVANKVMLLEKKTDNILQTVDLLRKTLDLPKVYIVLKNNDANSVGKIINNIGRYPQIKLKLVPNYYGLEDNVNLQNFLFNAESNYSFLDVKDIIVIYNLLKKNRLTTKKYITISGLGVKKPKVINVKLGTLVSDVLKKVELKNDQEYKIIINGLMKGKYLNISKMIVTNDLESIFLMPKDNYLVQPCLNCGLCYECCPRNLNPKYLKNLPKIPKEYLERCNGCNLCSYVCPAKINLNLKEDC